MGNRIKLNDSKLLAMKFLIWDSAIYGDLQGAAYVFERFLDGRRSDMAKDMSRKFFITICYGVENLIS